MSDTDRLSAIRERLEIEIDDTVRVRGSNTTGRVDRIDETGWAVIHHRNGVHGTDMSNLELVAKHPKPTDELSTLRARVIELETALAPFIAMKVRHNQLSIDHDKLMAAIKVAEAALSSGRAAAMGSEDIGL